MKNCAGIVYINQCENAVLMNGKLGCKFEGACEYQRPKQNEKVDELLEIGEPDDLSECEILNNMKENAEIKKQVKEQSHIIDNLGFDIEQAKEDCENLKCCGNCERYSRNLFYECEYYFCFDDIIVDHQTKKICPNWKSDGLTREEREIR